MDSVLTTAPDLLLGSDVLRRVDGSADAMAAGMTIDRRHRGADGRTAVGALGVLVDAVLGYSLIASLPPGSWTVSTEIWIDVLSPLPATGPVVCQARTAARGSFSTGEVLDGDGRLLAVCRERGRQIDDVPDAATLSAPPSLEPFDASAGLAALLGLVLSERPTLPVVPALLNPRRMLHGGVSLAACELVATASRASAGSTLATSSVHVTHTRAAPLGSTVEFDVATVHRGRTLWVSDVTGTVDGRTVVTARVSAE